MAVGNIYFYLFTALLAIHFIFAEENKGDDDEKDRWSVGFSFHRAANESRARPRPPRPQRGVCDYSTEPGVSCVGCNTVRVCLPNNVSLSRNCGRFRPYCDNGECGSTPSAACNETSTA